MKNKSFVSLAVLTIVICCLPAAHAAAQADVVTVGSVTAAGAVVDVPVYIRDTSGTPVGIDQPAGSRIEAYSIKVNYPAASVQSITFSRAGITASRTPTFENAPASSGSISLIDTFSEATNLLPFTSNAALPGDQVAHLMVTLAPGVTPGTVVPLTLDVVLTQVANEAGTMQETVANTQLTLVNGAITVPPGFVWSIPATSTITLALLAITLAAMAAIALRTRS